MLFGRGPGNSDAKVNLFGFQPVEIIRLLLVFFLAGYFGSVALGYLIVNLAPGSATVIGACLSGAAAGF